MNKLPRTGLYGEHYLSLYEGRCWFIYHNFRSADGVCEHRLRDPDNWGWDVKGELEGEDFNLPLELLL